MPALAMRQAERRTPRPHCVLLALLSLSPAGRVMAHDARPAPCVGSAWYLVTPTMDKRSLPAGVEAVVKKNPRPTDAMPYTGSAWLRNSGDVPLILVVDESQLAWFEGGPGAYDAGRKPAKRTDVS